MLTTALKTQKSLAVQDTPVSGPEQDPETPDLPPDHGANVQSAESCYKTGNKCCSQEKVRVTSMQNLQSHVWTLKSFSLLSEIGVTS